MKVMITGATGSLGSLLAESLVKKKHTVIGIGRQEPGKLGPEIMRLNNFSLIVYDLTDPRSLEGVPPPEAVIHLAAKLPVHLDPSLHGYIKANILSTLHVLKFCRQFKIQKFIFASSGSVFSAAPPGGVIREDSMPTPGDYYGMTKNFCEQLTMNELKDTHTRAIIVRISSAYGRHQSRNLVNRLFLQAKNNQDIVLRSEGKRYRNLIYDKDVIETLVRLLEYETVSPLEIFNVAGGDSRATFEIAQEIVRSTGSVSRIINGQEREHNDWDIYYDISKLDRAIRFRPMKIFDGINRFFSEDNRL